MSIGLSPAQSIQTPRVRVLMLDPNSHTLPYDRALARSLAMSGCQPELVVAPFLYSLDASKALAFEHRHFFRLAGGRLGRRLGLADRPRLRRLVKSLEYPGDWLRLIHLAHQRQPDIVHVQWSLQPTFERPLWRWFQQRGIPVVYTVHDIVPHAERPADLARLGRLYHQADGLIVHTDRAALELTQRFNLPSTMITVAPHGPLLEEEAPYAVALARQELGLPQGVPLILLAGLIEPYKGVTDLAIAFRYLAQRHPTVQLVIAGRPNVSIESERAYLAAAGLSGRVHCDLRFLPQSSLAAYLCAVDVVALPYRAGTASGLLMAARRFGRPVVVTDVGDLSVLVEDGISGLVVPPRDPMRLAEALERLISDLTWAEHLGRVGREITLAHASWAIAAARTLELYERVIERRRAVAPTS